MEDVFNKYIYLTHASQVLRFGKIKRFEIGRAAFNSLKNKVNMKQRNPYPQIDGFEMSLESVTIS